MSEWLGKIETAINEAVKSVAEWLTEQSWFEDLKSRWQDLDVQSKLYLRWGSIAVGGILGLFLLSSVLTSVTGPRSDYYSRLEIVDVIESASNEMRTLKRQTGADGAAESAIPWTEQFQRLATESSMDPSALVIGPETPGKQTDQIKEGIFDLKFKQITIRQLVGFLIKLQTSGRPARLDSIEVRTVGAEGYMDADTRVMTLAVVNKK